MSSSVRIASLGHVVLRVRNLEVAEAFYRDVLGIPISVRAPEWSMTFFTLGEHHDLALAEMSGEVEDAPDRAPGLDHIAFRLEGGDDALRAARDVLESAGVEVGGIDHGVTRSIYFADPDGNRVELYVNGDADWRSDPSLILSDAKPLPF